MIERETQFSQRASFIFLIYLLLKQLVLSQNGEGDTDRSIAFTVQVTEHLDRLVITFAFSVSVFQTFIILATEAFPEVEPYGVRTGEIGR